MGPCRGQHVCHLDSPKGTITRDHLGSSATLLHLNSYPELAAAAIVVCRGEHGWGEYLLLRHFDPCQALDALA